MLACRSLLQRARDCRSLLQRAHDWAREAIRFKMFAANGGDGAMHFFRWSQVLERIAQNLLTVIMN